MIAAAFSLFQDTNIKTLTPDRQKARTRGLQQRANDAGDFLQSQTFKKAHANASWIVPSCQSEIKSLFHHRLSPPVPLRLFH
jgi:hypothetical protein